MTETEEIDRRQLVEAVGRLGASLERFGEVCFLAGVQQERARISQIINCEAAKGRQEFALALALSGLDVPAAVEALEASHFTTPLASIHRESSIAH